MLKITLASRNLNLALCDFRNCGLHYWTVILKVASASLEDVGERHIVGPTQTYGIRNCRGRDQ